jgi:hypothetical protein
VVSPDMGLIGVSGIAGCQGFGDDGVLRDPTVHNCNGVPGQRFLSYNAGAGVTPDAFAQDFACLANVGTDGCGFEQQLEAMLKSLWPSVDQDPVTGQVTTPNRITFLEDATGLGKLGHGDLENKGFFRNDLDTLLGIVMVTDEEDCSSRSTMHFQPPQFLDPSSPLYTQDLNLRCYYNKQNLYEVNRYVAGLHALRGGNTDLVVFAAISGVPVELVNEQARSAVDFGNPSAREAYYQGLLNDPKMQETPDPARTPGNGNLLPSCTTATGVAYPPRRIVEVARQFGENGLVQSICQSDFAPALEAFLDKLSERFTESCVVE